LDDQSEFEIVMGALELGIVPPNRSISKSLEAMNPVERRTCKRKYRKIIRKEMVQGVMYKDVNATHRRGIAILACRKRGYQIVESG
jgi:ribosome biogenesis protein Tsr3